MNWEGPFFLVLVFAIFEALWLIEETDLIQGPIFLAILLAVTAFWAYTVLKRRQDEGTSERTPVEQLPNDWTTTARHLVKYPECNATDHLFGGKLLAWLDEGSAIYAQCQMGTKNLVTAHFGEVNFDVPVPRGSVVTLKARTLKEGDTSLTIEVKAEKIEDGDFDEPVEVVRNELVFVAIDEDGNPTEW